MSSVLTHQPPSIPLLFNCWDPHPCIHCSLLPDWTTAIVSCVVHHPKHHDYNQNSAACLLTHSCNWTTSNPSFRTSTGCWSSSAPTTSHHHLQSPPPSGSPLPVWAPPPAHPPALSGLKPGPCALRSHPLELTPPRTVQLQEILKDTLLQHCLRPLTSSALILLLCSVPLLLDCFIFVMFSVFRFD